MKLAEPTLYLMDAQQRRIGKVTIEQIVDNLLFGAFAPGPDFSAVADLFQQFEEAVNAQALSVVDELGADIAALGLRLCSPDHAEWVNIYTDFALWAGAYQLKRRRQEKYRKLPRERLYKSNPVTLMQ
jgi:hypothetical protein